MSDIQVFVVATQGIPLDRMDLEAREAYIPGSHEIITLRKTVLGRQATTIRALRRQKTETYPQTL